MHVPIMFQKAFLILAAVVAVTAQTGDRTVKVHIWPLSAANPKQLAEISYNPNTLTSTIIRFDKPEGPYSDEDPVRVGLHDGESSEWRGISTSSAVFDPQYQQKLSLHLDENGDVWHVGFSAQQKLAAKGKSKSKSKSKTKTKTASKSKSKSRKAVLPVEDEPAAPLMVEVLKPSPGPSPVLNKPVVLNADGKVPEKEQEKTFLQKYWWILAAFFLMQVMAAGGGGGK